jgi:hypothetical protein
MDDATDLCLVLVARCLAHEISPEVAIMEMLLTTEDAARVERILAGVPAGENDALVTALRRVLAENRAGCDRITSFLRSRTADADGPTSIDERLARTRRLFDQLICHGEELSVAFY